MKTALQVLASSGVATRSVHRVATGRTATWSARSQRTKITRGNVLDTFNLAD